MGRLTYEQLAAVLPEWTTSRNPHNRDFPTGRGGNRSRIGVTETRSATTTKRLPLHHCHKPINCPYLSHFGILWTDLKEQRDWKNNVISTLDNECMTFIFLFWKWRNHSPWLVQSYDGDIFSKCCINTRCDSISKIAIMILIPKRLRVFRFSDQSPPRGGMLILRFFCKTISKTAGFCTFVTWLSGRHREKFCEKAHLENFVKLTWIHLPWSLFLNKKGLQITYLFKWNSGTGTFQWMFWIS